MKKKILSITILILILLCNLCVYATDEQTEIPSKYDLRNDISIKVEKQLTNNSEKGPACYHYTKIKMIETYLQKTKGINYNLSETFYASHTEDGLYVLESDFPNQLFAQISNIDSKVELAKEKAVITNFKYARNISKDIKTVQKYIKNYGAVLVTLDIDNQWNNYNGGIYHKERHEGRFHSVVIIGWDDNYSKDNFYYEKPENDGAWLILNSWGSNWGNNGTAWVSYEDSYNLSGAEFIGSLTLSSGETIETKLEDKKQEEIKETEIKETETPVIEQPKKQNIFEKISNFFKSIFGF